MACEELVGGCFAGDRAPFAVQEKDQQRAFKYLKCCLKNDLHWADASKQIKDYLERKGVTQEEIVTQLDLARPMLQPWLD